MSDRIEDPVGGEFGYACGKLSCTRTTTKCSITEQALAQELRFNIMYINKL